MWFSLKEAVKAIIYGSVLIFNLITNTIRKKSMNIYSNVAYIDEFPDKRKKEIYTKNKKCVSWDEEQFEKEAELWGLSKNDKRIAKEERMNPADFIEAEERNDDELITDEWEK